MKRTFEEAFGQHNPTENVLTDLSFKYINQIGRETCKGSFLSTQSFPKHSENMDYDAYLNMDESALLAAARKIEKNVDEIPEQQLNFPRDIRRVKKYHSNNNHQNQLTKVTTDQPMSAELERVELQDKTLEKLEIEYLEKMTEDCRLPVSKDKALAMKKYTDMLINAISEQKEKEMLRAKAENTVLKRAFRIQTDITDRVRHSEAGLKSELEKVNDSLQQVVYENKLLQRKMREYQAREMEESMASSHLGPRRDIEGF